MPLAKRFKLGLSSCWGHTATPTSAVNTEEEKKEKKEVKPYDFSRHPEHAVWRRAEAAAARTRHHPSPEDYLVPWSHAAAAKGATSNVCTLAPVPGAGLATLFLRTTLSPTALANRLHAEFFDDSSLSVKPHGGDDKAGKKKTKSPDRPTGTVTGAVIAPKDGSTPPLVIEAPPGGYMYGPVLALTSTTPDALETLDYLESIFPTGYAVLLPHTKLESNVRTAKGNVRLTTRTGVQQIAAKETPSAKSLATIFELELDLAPMFDSPAGHPPHAVGDSVVARAVIAYRDATGWPSLGPTIQSIEVRRDYQGSLLVQDLFNAIERWFVRFWTLDSQPGWRCLKATQLEDYVIDRRPQVDGDDPSEENHVLTDKKFIYDVMHFSSNYPNPTDPLGQLGTDVPPETHAIKFYPPAGTIVPMPTVAAYSEFSAAHGWRSCDNCRIPEEDWGSSLLVCAGCALPTYWRAHYCSRGCQRQHWAVHRLCCRKTYAEVCAGKQAVENSILAEAAAAAAAAAGAQG
eukprot:g3032.t1